jgi:hypothetical protein
MTTTPTTVFVLVSGDDLEIFSERPVTPSLGSDPGNWPPAFRLYIADVDGGDSALIEEVRPPATAPRWHTEELAGDVLEMMMADAADGRFDVELGSWAEVPELERFELVNEAIAVALENELRGEPTAGAPIPRQPGPDRMALEAELEATVARKISEAGCLDAAAPRLADVRRWR